MRILVVDDSVEAADSLALRLVRAGHTVKVAYDGPTALNVAASFEPEAVILDMAMPGMDGLATARGLRGLSQTKRSILIGVSGYSREEDHHRACEAGFDHYLIKPAAFDELRSLLVEPGLHQASF